MKKLILIGAGGHCKSCIEVINEKNEYKIFGILDNDKNLKEKTLNDYKILGSDKLLDILSRKIGSAFITVGQIHSYIPRKKLFQLLKKYKFHLPVIKSKTALISKNAVISQGTIIMQQTIVNSNTIVGSNCILNNKSLLEHDVVVGNNCHISTGAIVNGGCKIGSNSFIGSGAVIANNTKIKENSFIKAGLVIK